jgi:cytochrome c-type biogenesis protein CcmH/NrfF
MRRTASLVALAACAAALSAVSAGSVAEAQSSCLRSWPEARFGALAYNHIVHINNACTQDADCDVSTDVNPEVQQVVVASHSEVQVMTFMGSPARTFKPNVRCVMRAE